LSTKKGTGLEQNSVSASNFHPGGLKRERCGLQAGRTALNSPVKKLLNAGEQIACGVTNGGTPQVASRPPEMAIHCRRRNIAKLGTSIDDASQRCKIERVGLPRVRPTSNRDLSRLNSAKLKLPKRLAQASS